MSVFWVQPIDWALLPRAALGVLALLCGNGFIVGINQIYDVDVDTVNKPFLPVAAGKRAQSESPLLNGASCIGAFIWKSKAISSNIIRQIEMSLGMCNLDAVMLAWKQACTDISCRLLNSEVFYALQENYLQDWLGFWLWV